MLREIEEKVARERERARVSDQRERQLEGAGRKREAVRKTNILIFGLLISPASSLRQRPTVSVTVSLRPTLAVVGYMRAKKMPVVCGDEEEEEVLSQV